jgi:hypothetical protein
MPTQSMRKTRREKKEEEKREKESFIGLNESCHSLALSLSFSFVETVCCC